jgi:transposase
VARLVIEVGTHSAWVQDVISEWGHEVLVANPRMMEGSKRRARLEAEWIAIPFS